MKLLILAALILNPIFGFAKSESSVLLKNEVSLATLISSFEVIKENEELKIQISNFNGVKKTESLNKLEEYQEYSKYSFKNPFDDSKKGYELFVFNKVKPTLSEVRDSDLDLTGLEVNLYVLMNGKKTEKIKGEFFYKDNLIANSAVDTNIQIKIINDLSLQIKNSKLKEIKVTKNLLDTDKRTLEMQVQILELNKQVNQNIKLNLLNIKKTPIVIEESEDNEELEGIENETTTNHS